MRGDACSKLNINAHTHLPFSALHLLAADAPDPAGAGDRPAACGDLQTGGGDRHIVCADRRSLHAASRRRANLHSLAHDQVISVVNRLLNIANGVVDNIGPGRNGGQREQGE